MKWSYSFWQKNWTKILWESVLEISRDWNSLGFSMAYLKQETTMERWVPRNVNISRINFIMPPVCYTLYRSLNKIIKQFYMKNCKVAVVKELPSRVRLVGFE